MIGVGEQFPSMHLTGVDLDNSIMTIDILAPEDWSVVYFYPKDFTFICPTEITAMDKLVDDADVIGVSGDNEFCKIAWKTADGRIRNIKHILAADCGLLASNKLYLVYYSLIN